MNSIRRELLKRGLAYLMAHRIARPKPKPGNFDDDEMGLDEDGIIIRPPLVPKDQQNEN